MSKVFSAMAVSVDGYITGHDPRPGHGLGGGVVTAALAAGLVDELVLHQVPVLLGVGRPYFQALPAHVQLRLLDAVATLGVTHLHYAVER